MLVDVHKVMATLFNVELNEFLARFEKFKTFETVHTGGFMEIKYREAHQFYTYVSWLNDFREQLYRKSEGFKMELSSFQREMELLLELYIHLKLLAEHHVFSKEAGDELDRYFLKPFLRFIKGLDETFGGNYFQSRIDELLNKAVDVKIKLINVFKAPIANVEVTVSYVRFPEFKEYAKAYNLCTLKTDDLGIANIRLLRPREGCYRIDVRKYNKIAFLDVKSSNYIEIKAFDLPKLIKHAVSKVLGRKIGR